MIIIICSPKYSFVTSGTSSHCGVADTTPPPQQTLPQSGTIVQNLVYFMLIGCLKYTIYHIYDTISWVFLRQFFSVTVIHNHFSAIFYFTFVHKSQKLLPCDKTFGTFVKTFW